MMKTTATNWVNVTIGDKTVKIVTELGRKPVTKRINIEEINVKPLLIALTSVGVECGANRRIQKIEDTKVTVDKDGKININEGCTEERVHWTLCANCTGESLHRLIIAIREERGENV